MWIEKKFDYFQISEGFGMKNLNTIFLMLGLCDLMSTIKTPK